MDHGVTGENLRYEPKASSAARTACMKSRIFAASLIPGFPATSTPDDTSTAYGRAMRIASPTFAALSPPARPNRGNCMCCASIPCDSTKRRQSNVTPDPPKGGEL